MYIFLYKTRKETEEMNSNYLKLKSCCCHNLYIKTQFENGIERTKKSVKSVNF